MKRFFVSFFVFIFFLSFSTNQTTVFAENNYRGIKAAVGVAGIAGSVVLWRHFGKKIEKIERLQKVFEKVRGIDHGYAERIKKLLLYKHLCLFGTLLSFGYTVKQVAGILKKALEEVQVRKEAEVLEEDRVRKEAKKKKKTRERLDGSSSAFFRIDACDVRELVQIFWKEVEGKFLVWKSEFSNLKNIKDWKSIQNDCFFVELKNSDEMCSAMEWMQTARSNMNTESLLRIRQRWATLKTDLEDYLKEEDTSS